MKRFCNYWNKPNETPLDRNMILAADMKASAARVVSRKI